MPIPERPVNNQPSGDRKLTNSVLLQQASTKRFRGVTTDQIYQLRGLSEEEYVQFDWGNQSSPNTRQIKRLKETVDAFFLQDFPEDV